MVLCLGILIACAIGIANMSIPASGYIADPARTKGEQKDALEALRDGVAKSLSGNGIEAVTIASGVIAPAQGIIKVDTEGGAGTDDLGFINPAAFDDGDLLFLRTANNGHDVTLLNSAAETDGVIRCFGNSDIDLTLTSTAVLLQLSKTTTPKEWVMKGYFPAWESGALEDWRVRHGIALHGSELFTASGPFIVPAGVTKLEAYLLSGPGGGGGGGDTGGNGASGTDGGDTFIENAAPTVIARADGGGTGGGGGAQLNTGGAPGKSNNSGAVGDSTGGYAGQRGSAGIASAAGKGGPGADAPLLPGVKGGAGGDATAVSCGGGGGGGIGAAFVILTVTPGEVLDITIGAAGSGGAGGSSPTGDGAAGSGGGAVLLRW